MAATKKRKAGSTKTKASKVEAEVSSAPAAPPGPSKVDVEAALRRARELEEQNEALQAQIEELEERAEEADDPEEIREQIASAKAATYDPTVFGLLRHEEISAILAHKIGLDRAASEQIKAQTERDAGLFTGLASFNQASIDQRRADAEAIAREREYANDWRKKSTEAELRVAEMVRQGEDAKLERERLAADLERAEQATRRLAMELQHKENMRRDELSMIGQMAAPIAGVVAGGARALIAQYAGGSGGGLGGGAPGAPGVPPTGSPGLPSSPPPGGTPPGAPGAQPQFDVNLEGVDAFWAALTDVLNTSNNDARACLRAVICSYLLDGAPRVPSELPAVLRGAVVKSAGAERVMRLLELCQNAYVAASAPTPPPHANGAASVN